MFMSTFVALCLLALPPGDCPGGCYRQHHLPLVGRHIVPSVDGEFDWWGDYGDLLAGEGFIMPQLPEPAAPLVILRSLDSGALGQTTFLASSDRPHYWTAVPFGPLAVEVQISLAEIDPATVEYVVLLLDGKPIENNRYSAPAQQATMPIADGQPRVAYVFNLPCPAPGKHIVQARYKRTSLWSRLSKPLYFDVRLPDPPRIVAISDINGVPAPVREAGLISITKSEVIVRLANVSQNASVVAYLDGKPISTALAQESCCRTIRLEGHITPGIHSLRLRTVTSGGSCSVTSEPSDEVVFQYYDEDVYLLRPNRRCNSCPTPASSGSQASHAVAPPPAEAALSQQPARRFVTASETNTHDIQLAGFSREDRDNPFRAASLLRETAEEAANVRLVTFLAESPADEAIRFRGEAIVFAGAAFQSEKDAGTCAEAARQRAAGAEAAAKEAASAKTEAEAALVRAQAGAAVSDKAAQVTVLSSTPEAKDARDTVAAAKAAAANALQQAYTAARQAGYKAQESAQNARDAQRIYADSLRAKQEVETAHQRAFEAAEQTQKLADEAIALVNQDAQKTQEKCNQAAIERNRAAEWMNIAKDKADLAAGLANTAEDCRRQADGAKIATQTQMQNARDAAGTAEQSGASARAAAMTAVQITIDAVIHSITNAIKMTDADGQADAARMSAAAAKAAAVAAAADADQAQTAYDAAVRWADEATSQAGKADAYVVEESNGGDTARLRVASTHAIQAVQNRDAAHHQKQLAADACNQAHQEAGQAYQASVDAQAIAATAQQDENNARQHADAAAAARGDAEAAEQAAREAVTMCQSAATTNDLDLATKAILQALNAWQTVERRSHDAEIQLGLARPFAAAAAPTMDCVEKESTKAKAARHRADEHKNRAEVAAKSAANYAATAAQNAADAGRLLDLATLIEKRRDISKVEEEQRAVLPLLRDLDVQLAPNRAEAIGQLAAEEEAEAEVRIAIGQARDRIERARAIQGLPSPFYFASAAHFPLPSFGLRGEMIDRGGLIIYEDMEFRFDRDGNYEVRFRATTPAMPTTVELQFQIQPGRGGPWYTVTLAPIEFKYPDPNAAKPKCTAATNCTAAQEQQCCGPVRDCICKGRNEILRRCYGEMGQEATIRRTGTARFGFGVGVP